MNNSVRIIPKPNLPYDEIEDAMVERASHAICKVVNATIDGILGNANTLVLARAALKAALNGGE